MTSEQFVYWLQGYMEIANPEKLGKKEVEEIKNHLKLVFKKETPNVTIFPNIQDEKTHVGFPRHPLKPEIIY